MIKDEWKRLRKNPLLIIVLCVIILIPSIYAGLFLASMWDPYGELDKLPVAVVNLDKCVEYNDSTLSVGDDLVENLKENESLEFHFVDQSTAETGLKDGTYYCVVTIPENFSENASTLMDEDPQTMELSYETDPATNYVAMKLSESALTKIELSLQEEVTETYAKSMFEQLHDAGDGLQEAADGTSEILDGENEIADGVSDLKDGGDELSDGANTLYSGTQTLYSKMDDFEGGAAALRNGVASYTEGTSQIADGITSLNSSTGSLASGVAALDSSAQTLAGGIRTLDQTLNTAMAEEEKATVANTAKSAVDANLADDTNSQSYNNIKSTAEDTFYASVASDSNKTAAAKEAADTASETIAAQADSIASSASTQAVASVTAQADDIASSASTQAKQSVESNADTIGSQASSQAVASVQANADTTKSTAASAVLSSSDYQAGKQQILTGVQSSLSSGVSSNKDTVVSAVANGSADSVNQIALSIGDAVARAQGLSETDDAYAATVQTVAANYTSVLNQLVSGVAGNTVDGIANAAAATDLSTLSAGIDTLTQTAVGTAAESVAETTAASVASSVARNVSSSTAEQVAGSVATSVSAETADSVASSVARSVSSQVATQVASSTASSVVDSVAAEAKGSVGTSVADAVKQAAESAAQTAAVSGAEAAKQSVASAIEEQDSLTGYSLVTGMEALAAGTNTLNGSVPELTSGISQLYAGSSQLVANSDSLNSGAAAIDSASAQVADGVSELNSGASQLADGTAELDNGITTLDDSMPELTDGTTELKNALSDGAEEIADVNDTDATYEMFANPVDAVESKLTDVANNGSAMAAYMMSVGLWVGALAFCLLYPLTKHKKLGEVQGGAKGLRWWFSKSTILYPMSLIMGLILIWILHVALGFEPARMGETIFAACLTACAFMAIQYLFNAMLGEVGSFLMLVFMVLNLAGSAGTYPLEVSGPLAKALHAFVPFTYTVTAFRSTIGGGEDVTYCYIYLGAMLVVSSILTIILFMIRAKEEKDNKASLHQWLEKHEFA